MTDDVAVAEASGVDVEAEAGADKRVVPAAAPKALGLRDVWREFCKSTTMHGLRYLVDEGRTKFDKAFWTVSLVAMLACCVALLVHMYQRWLISPSMATNELKMQPVWEVPFPAVTICPETKFRNSEFDLDVSSLLLAETQDPDDKAALRRKVDTLLLHCDNTTAGISRHLSDEDLDFLTALAPQAEKTVRVTMWRNNQYTNLMNSTNTGLEWWVPILTDEGLCFSFNLLSPEDMFRTSTVKLNRTDGNTPPRVRHWSLSGGYTKDASADDGYPARAWRGFPGKLAVLLFAAVPDMHYTCRGPMQGYKIAVHSPAEIPHMQPRTRLLLGEELLVNVKPSSISTSEDLRYYTPLDRRCFLPEERQLEYFQVYTKRNCELECASNVSMQHCGCVAFFMPRSADVPVCGPAKTACLREATHLMEGLELLAERQRRRRQEPSHGCNCLADCVALEYGVEHYRSAYEWERSTSAFRYNGSDFFGNDLARVTIMIKEKMVLSNQRSELYSMEKFFAACAGVLGLFTGFSLINIIEAVFFMVWGVVAKIYHKAKHALCRA